MRILTAIAAATLMLGVLTLSSCGKENCLRKRGYSSCEDLKSAFNLQDKDEVIRYHDIAKQCGCWEKQ